jgi:hypothetical protein
MSLELHQLELIVLARHHYCKALSQEFCWYADECVSGSEVRERAFHLRRFETIAEMLPESRVQEVVDNAESDLKRRVGEEVYQDFRTHGFPSSRADADA